MMLPNLFAGLFGMGVSSVFLWFAIRHENRGFMVISVLCAACGAVNLGIYTYYA